MPLTLRVRDVTAATPRSRIVRLDLNGHAFDYAPGQAVVIVESDAGKRRPYSIAAAPEDARHDRCLELLVGIDGEGRGGPPFPLEPGSPVDIEGPVGTFTFPDAPEERDFVFVAGGTGIAPLRAMMRHAIANPARIDHVGLLYSARTPDEFAYAEEFRALASRGVIELRQTVTRASEEIDWSGIRGRIDRTALTALVHDPRTLCFVCGPAAMVDDIPRLLGEIGVARERIKIEDW